MPWKNSSLQQRGKLIFPTNPTRQRLTIPRSAAGVLVSDTKGRDIKMDQYTLSFHGRLLIEGAEVTLNYGQRYGLLGENGSGKVPCSLQSCVSSSDPIILVYIPAINRRTRYSYPRPY